MNLAINDVDGSVNNQTSFGMLWSKNRLWSPASGDEDFRPMSLRLIPAPARGPEQSAPAWSFNLRPGSDHCTLECGHGSVIAQQFFILPVPCHTRSEGPRCHVRLGWFGRTDTLQCQR